MEPSQISSATGMDWTLIATAVGGAIYGGWQQFRASKKDKSEAEKIAKDQVIEAKDKLIETITAERNSWRDRHDEKSKELDNHRQSYHAKNGELQAKLLEATAETSALRAKTDLTPILQHQERDAEITTKIMETLETMTKILKGLVGIVDKSKNENDEIVKN